MFIVCFCLPFFYLKVWGLFQFVCWMVGWLVKWFVLVQVLSEGIMGKSQWKILEQAFSNTTLTTGPNVSASDKVTHVSALIYVTASLWGFFQNLINCLHTLLCIF